MLADLAARFSSRFAAKVYRGPLFGLVPTDLMLSLLAKRSYLLYRLWYRYNVASNRFFDLRAAPSTATVDQRALASMRSDGTAIIRNAFDPAQVAEALAFVLDLFDRSAAHRAKERGASPFARWESDGIDHEYHPRTGRSRFFFTREHLPSLPPLVARFFDEPSIHALAERYFGSTQVRAGEPYMIAEVLEPADHLETWHIDEVRPSIKAFLHLVDVTDEQGPLRVIPRTHLESDEQHALFYRICRHGLAGAYFEPEEDDALDRRGTTMSAPANSLILFDTRALHAGSHCRSGRRIILVSGYRPLFTSRLTPRMFRDPDPATLYWQRHAEAPQP
jgi:hypothetical protein